MLGGTIKNRTRTPAVKVQVSAFYPPSGLNPNI